MMYFCTMKMKVWIQRLQYLCLLLLAIVIPLNRRLFPPIFATYVLLCVLEGDFRNRWRTIRKRGLLPFLIACAVMYAVYLVALIWSNNYPFAYRDLLLKSPLLLFPLCLFASDSLLFTNRRLFNLAYAFLTGCLLYALYVLYVWVCKVGIDGIWSSFHISGSGWVAHHSYISMCYLLAIAIVLFILIEKNPPMWVKLLLVLAAWIFIFQVIVLASRTAWIVSALLLLVSFVYLVIQTFRGRLKPLLLVVFVLLSLITVFFVRSVPSANNRCLQTFQRVKEARDLRTADIRWYIWESSLDVIEEHPIWGVGTGDVRDSLTEKQREAGIPSFNSHNQFLNTWVAVGIFGLLAFVVLLLMSLWRSFRYKSLLYFVFLLIIIGNCLTESILEKQMGLVFFVYFDSYLYAFVSVRNEKRGDASETAVLSETA